MFAVIKAGGKQYRVQTEECIKTAKAPKPVGEALVFEDVLLFTDETGQTHVGAPNLPNVLVEGEVVEHGRDAKVIAFKKRRRQNSRRKRGHRQDHTIVKITKIALKA